MYIYTYIHTQLPLLVTLKKVYDRNVVNKYRLYLLLGVIIFNLIDYIYIYIHMYDMTNFISSHKKLHCSAQELHTI